MTDSSGKPIDPFKTARRVPAVVASLRVADVQAIRPDWTVAQAEAFLLNYASVIGEVMLRAGTAVIVELMEGHDYVQ